MMLKDDRRGFKHAGVTRCEINSALVEHVRNEQPFITPLLPGFGPLIDTPVSTDSYME